MSVISKFTKFKLFLLQNKYSSLSNHQLSNTKKSLFIYYFFIIFEFALE